MAPHGNNDNNNGLAYKIELDNKMKRSLLNKLFFKLNQSCVESIIAIFVHWCE